jgi:60 kDa SS-A/Ro ribonucleoprotein
MTAMIRNLATMTRTGLLSPFSDATKKVVEELNEDRIKKSKVHPIAILMALKTYTQGRGERGKNTWIPIPQIIEALDSAFYMAFQNVESTGKRWYLGVDVSGSMWVGSVAGCTGLTPGIAAGAMALVSARTEKSWYMGAFNTEMVPFAPTAKQRLDDFCNSISRLPWGGTDCSLPMKHALKERWSVDVFVVYTDNETRAGDKHPIQALNEYRQKMGIPAKLIVCGMTSTGFSIADPEDAGMMDVVGFDSTAPQVIADFARS